MNARSPSTAGQAAVTVTAPDGVELSVREWGNPHGPAILLIHGLAQSHLCFAPQYRSDLALRHRLVAFDLRGHGASAKPLAPEHYRDGRRWADDVAAVMAARRLERPVLVGWSLGGRVIRQYLMHHGDAALGGLNIVAARPIEHPSVVGPGSSALQEASADLEGRLRTAIGFLRDCWHKQPAAADFELALAYNMIVPAEVRDAITGWATDPEATVAALRRVSVPTLISHGRLDRLVLPKAAEMTRDAIPGACISFYDDCGHSPFAEASERFNRELAELVAAAAKAA